MNKTEMVYQFMETMDQIKSIPKDFNELTVKDKDNIAFRYNLLIEQLEKLFDSSFKDISTFYPIFQYLKTMIQFHSKDIDIDRDKVLESLVDIEYVNIGTGIHLQLPLDQTFPVVHSNNMSKYDKFSGRVNKRGDGKVTAPFDYQPKDIKVDN